MTASRPAPTSAQIRDMTTEKSVRDSSGGITIPPTQPALPEDIATVRRNLNVNGAAAALAHERQTAAEAAFPDSEWSQTAVLVAFRDAHNQGWDAAIRALTAGGQETKWRALNGAWVHFSDEKTATEYASQVKTDNADDECAGLIQKQLVSRSEWVNTEG